MQEKQRLHISGGGASLILLTFLVLCLVSFAALSLVSARADEKLTDKYADMTQDYYRARNEAMRFLASADKSLRAGALPDLSEYGTPMDAAGEETRALAFPMNDTQQLVLVFSIEDGEDGARIRVERLAAEQIRTPSYDTRLPVYGADEAPRQ